MNSQKSNRGAPRKTKSKKNLGKRGRARAGRSNENDTRGMGPSFGGMPRSTVGVNYGAKMIERDELVQAINGSVSFATTKFQYNPGLAATFPGLSKDAANYSEWQCVSSVFYVKPLVSAFSTQGQSGETIISFDPNALGAAPTTQAQAEFFWHNQAAPYQEFELSIPPRQVNRSDAKYLRSGAAPAGSDLKTYDGGNIYVSTYGQGGTAACCELRHKSRFMVFAPTLLLASGSGATSQTAMFQSTSAEAAAATTVAKTLALATASSNGLGAVNTAGSIVPPSGTYAVDVDVLAVGSGANLTAFKLDLLKNGASTQQTAFNFVTSGPDASAQATSGGHISQIVTCNGTDALTVTSTLTYASGSATTWGTIRFVPC